MPACPGCGAANDASSARCEYCGTALGEASTMVLEWSASTGEGVHASGQVQLTVPAGADAGQVKAQITAAYAKAVDAVGADAPSDQVRDALWQELERLLPPGQKLQDLTLTAHKRVAPAGGPKAGNGCAQAWLLAGVFAAVSFCCAFGGTWMRHDFERQIKLLEGLTVVTLEQAATTQGTVVLESVVATVDSGQAVTLAGRTSVDCLYYTGQPEEVKGRKGKTVTEQVQAFKVGNLTVETANLTWHDPVKLVNAPGTWQGFKVGDRVTLVGEQKEGVFRGGSMFMLASEPSKEALIADLRQDAEAGNAFQWLCGVFGLVMMVCAGLLARRRS